MSAIDQLVRRMEDRRGRAAFIHFATAATYGELCAMVAEAGRAIAEAGVNRGDVVLLRGKFSAAGTAMLLAIARAGAVAMPLEPDVEDWEGRSEIAQASWIFSDEGPGGNKAGFVLGRLPAVPTTRSEEVARLFGELHTRNHGGLILFSSGTTGQPKAMLHDLTALIGAYLRAKERELRVLAVLRFDHIGGLDALFRALAGGATLVVPDERTPEAVARAIEMHAAEILPASPTFLNLLLLSKAWEGRDLRSLRIVGYGAEAMPEPLLKRLRAAFPDVEFQQKFGVSETGAMRIISRASDSVEFRIQDEGIDYRVEDGELLLKSKSRILGYLNVKSDAITGDGWYRTGDLVEESGEGFLRIIGRKQELINVGGRKVHPSKVEAVLHEIDQIDDCLVFGRSSPILGQVVATCIVPSCEISPMQLRKRIREHCKTRLADYETPLEIEIVARIDTTRTGKKKRSKTGS